MTDAVPAGRHMIDAAQASVTFRRQRGGVAKDPFGHTAVGFSAQGQIKRWACRLDFMLDTLSPDEVLLILQTERVLQPSGARA